MMLEPSTRIMTTSSRGSWIWPTTTRGTFGGRCVTAWRSVMVCVPVWLDQLQVPFFCVAGSNSVCSRISDRAKTDPAVLAPPTGERNTTAELLELEWNQLRFRYVPSVGHLISSATVSASLPSYGMVSFQRL